MEEQHILNKNSLMALLSRLLKEKNRASSYPRITRKFRFDSEFDVRVWLSFSKFSLYEFKYVRKKLICPLIIEEFKQSLLTENHEFYLTLKKIYDKNNKQFDVDSLIDNFLAEGDTTSFAIFSIENAFDECVEDSDDIRKVIEIEKEYKRRLLR